MKKHFIYALVFFSVLLTACSSLKTAIYDQYSYQQDVSLKVETANLLKHATEPYANYKEQAEKLLLDMEKMEEYEKNKPSNTVSYKLWEVMTDQEKNSVAGLLKLWKEKGQLSPVFLTEASSQIEAAFNILIKYEVSKDKEQESALLQIINNI